MLAKVKPRDHTGHLYKKKMSILNIFEVNKYLIGKSIYRI